MKDLVYFVNVPFTRLLADSPRGNATALKIEAFGKLESGWRYGRGKSFKRKVLNAASRINFDALLAGFTETNAFPGREGDVTVTIYSADNCYSFRVYENLSVSFLHENDNGEVSGPTGMTLSEAEIKIRELGESQWSLSCLYISATTTTDWGGFEVRPLRIRLTEAEFPPSPGIVLKRQGYQFVTMHGDITQTRPTSRRLSGNSLRRSFQPVT